MTRQYFFCVVDCISPWDWLLEKRSGDTTEGGPAKYQPPLSVALLPVAKCGLTMRPLPRWIFPQTLNWALTRIGQSANYFRPHLERSMLEARQQRPNLLKVPPKKNQHNTSACTLVPLKSP